MEVGEPFSAADDAAMLRMRLDGLSWREIGARLNRCHVSCQRRWDKASMARRLKRLRQEQPAPPPRPAPDPDAAWLASPNRGAMPAGHPVSWGAIQGAAGSDAGR